MILEFQWGPSRGLQVNQQKRRALLMRSSHRVDHIKAKWASTKVQPEIQAPSEVTEQSKAEESPPVSCRVKTKEAEHKTNNSKRGHAEQQQTTWKSGFIMQKNPKLPSPGIFTLYHLIVLHYIMIFYNNKSPDALL